MLDSKHGENATYTARERHTSEINLAFTIWRYCLAVAECSPPFALTFIDEAHGISSKYSRERRGVPGVFDT